VSSADEFLNIDTPENVVFGYEVVGIGSRFMAALVDTILIVIIQLIANITLVLIAGALGFDETAGAIALAVMSLLSFALFWGYYIFFEMLWNGKSPGKQLVGLRVIRQDGTPITLAESVIRNLVRLVDFLPVGYGVGLVAMFIDGQSRRLGDMAASTLVVREQETVTLESLKQNAPMSGRYSSEIVAQTSEWPVERLTNADIQLAEDFLRRRYEIKDSTILAVQILQRLITRMGMSRADMKYPDPIYALDRIVKAHQARQSK
jgi:uncharacterized RDD family membrane protein YckC